MKIDNSYHWMICEEDGKYIGPVCGPVFWPEGIEAFNLPELKAIVAEMEKMQNG